MFESVKGQQYCLEVNSGSEKKNTLAIKKNEEIVDQTSAVFNSGGVQLICLDFFDAVNKTFPFRCCGEIVDLEDINLLVPCVLCHCFFCFPNLI